MARPPAQRIQHEMPLHTESDGASFFLSFLQLFREMTFFASKERRIYKQLLDSVFHFSKEKTRLKQKWVRHSGEV